MPQVREVMTAGPTTVSPSTPVRAAARMMVEQDVGPLPVVDEDDQHLVGIVTDRDLVVRVLAEDRDPDSTTIGEVASREIVTVEPDADLDRALQLMAENQVRRIPVVDSERLVGILAQADVAREGDAETLGAVVEEISR
jgi:CBS domain-containing protein